MHGVAALILLAASRVDPSTLCDECAPPTPTGIYIGLGLMAAVAVLIPLGSRTLRRRRERPPRLPRVRSEPEAALAAAAGLAVHEVRSDAGELFHAVQAAWDAQDEARLGELVAPELLARWNLARATREQLWASPVRVDGGVDVEFVEVAASGPGGEQRVLVRFQAPLDGWAPPGAAGERLRRRAPR